MAVTPACPATVIMSRSISGLQGAIRSSFGGWGEFDSPGLKLIHASLCYTAASNVDISSAAQQNDPRVSRQGRRVFVNSSWDKVLLYLKKQRKAITCSYHNCCSEWQETLQFTEIPSDKRIGKPNSCKRSFMFVGFSLLILQLYFVTIVQEGVCGPVKKQEGRAPRQ